MSIFNPNREFSNAEKLFAITVCLFIGFSLNTLIVGPLIQYSTNNFVYKLLLILSSALTFGFPAFCVSLILKKEEKASSYIGFRKSNFGKNPFVYYCLIVVFMLAILPAIEFVATLNSMYSFPESLKVLEEYFRETESRSLEATQKALVANSFGELLLNLCALAIAPAVFEEMFFRGILQKKLIRITKKPIVGILLTAFIFSAIHMQFSGIVPRFILGAVLGYMFYKSGTLWTSILAHFTNNAIVVCVAYFTEINTTETPDLSNYANPIWICAIVAGL